jgi:hypothetical protein
LTPAVRLAGLLFALTAAAGAASQGQSERTAPPSAFTLESLAPLLASWIASERDAAKAEGVEPVPKAIRSELEGYVPGPILDRARWREGASQISMPQNLIRFGHVPAVTLDDVIVFQDRRAALEDPKLWVHELKHVMQFAEWGVDGFALRYLKDYEAVEHEAAEFRWQFMKERGLVPEPAAPVEQR